MNTDIDDIFSKATRFRNAIEIADFSIETVGREAHLRMEGFPDGVCSEACTILGIYLKNKLNIPSLVEKAGQIELNEKWYGTHHWLESNGLIIDITADQFPMVSEKVLVTYSSDFHERYTQKVSQMTDTFILENQSEWMQRIFGSVLKVLE